MKKLLVLIMVFLLLLSVLTSCVDDKNIDENSVSGEEITQDTCDEVFIETDKNGNEEWYTTAKPVIYLYPETKIDVDIKLDYNGKLYCTYPEYNGVWSVTAYPDGTIIDKTTGKEYSYLFWDGFCHVEYDMSRGFVVKGEDTAEFLQETLAKMGLTPVEYNEFIVYWLPQMQSNAYNLITFQTDAYTDNAKLTVTPTPDNVLRIFMVYKALDEPVVVEEPVIEPFVREGFCVVEWGGSKIK